MPGDLAGPLQLHLVVGRLVQPDKTRPRFLLGPAESETAKRELAMTAESPGGNRSARCRQGGVC